MGRLTSLLLAFCLAGARSCDAFISTASEHVHGFRVSNSCLWGCTTRKEAVSRVVGMTSAWLLLASTTNNKRANADVSDGDRLPQGAAQFSRVLRLSSDIKAVRKRAATQQAKDDTGIDDKEWDNIGKFLRTAYSTGDDMKGIASGIGNPDNKKRALEDIDQLRKYAQAGDVSVNRKDPSGLVPVLDKMDGLVSDFLESLSDVPDEI